MTYSMLKILVVPAHGGVRFSRETRNYSIVMDHRKIAKEGMYRSCSCGCMEETDCLTHFVTKYLEALQ